MLAFLVVITLASLALPGGAALAHADEPLAPHDLWSAWNWDFTILLGIALAGLLYTRALRALWKSAGPGGGVTYWQAAGFYTGLAVLFAALVSPLDAMSGVLFSAHMTQHLLLMMVAAPLLVFGARPAVLAWAFPTGRRVYLARAWRRRSSLRFAWSRLSSPLSAWLLHAAAFTAWHVPGPYQAAVRDEFLHFLEHASFLGAALLFWWVLSHSSPRGAFNYGAGMLFVFSMAMYSGVFGALITFSRQVWYPLYTGYVHLWGLTPHEDQQLAGAIMWIPGNFIYLIAFLSLLAAWFRAMERSENRGAAMRPSRKS